MEKKIFIIILALLLCSVFATPYAAAQAPRDIMLVLDNSGSMRQNDPRFLTKKVVSDFVARLSADTHIGIVIFDEKVNLALPLSPGGTGETKHTIHATLNKLNYRGKLTDSPAGMERAIYELKNKGRKDASKVIVFMTDGIVDTGDKARDLERARWLREDLAAQSQRLGIRIFGIAFTDQADFQLIQALGEKTGGGYYRALKADEIPHIFEQIDSSIQAPLPNPQETTKPGERKDASSGLMVIVSIVVLGVIALAVIVIRGKKSGGAAGAGAGTISPSSRSVKLPKAQLKDIREVSGKTEYLIKSDSFNIGRAADNDVVIDKSTVSTRQATITHHDNAFYLVDQRSTNGTFVNGEKLTGELKLKHGDRIGFDQYEFVFVMEAYSDDMKTQLRGPVIQGDQAANARTPGQGNQAAQADDDGPTKLKDMCLNHPSWKATELCPICKTAVCDKCMVENKGQKVCRGCAEKEA